MKENPDCIVARKPCCHRIIYAAVNNPKVIDAEAKKEIGELVAMGCTIEHMTAAEVRKSDFGCECHKALMEKVEAIISPKNGLGAAGARMQGRGRDTASQQTLSPNKLRHDAPPSKP